MSKVRTRFAPSPTGFLHVGGARTALFNYLYARAMGGQFILRIEDTDQQRSTPESYKLMVESLDWLGISWDEGPVSDNLEKYKGEYGPYLQSERLTNYREMTEKLVGSGKAYPCFCTAEELEQRKKQRESEGLPPVYDLKCRALSKDVVDNNMKSGKPYVTRLKSSDKSITVNDMIQGVVTFDSKILGDFILVKSDGFPSYNYAVVVDDHLMKISHVIRGVGHLSNTPKQILIYEAFGWEQPAWAHISEIVGNDNKKLSKRQGATSITVFRDLGYPREAFINYMTLLGWSAPDEEEFLALSRLEKEFDVARCHKNPARFDVFKKTEGIEISQLTASELQPLLYEKSKLNHLSNLHIRAKTEDDFLTDVLPFVEEVLPGIASKDNEKLVSILLALRVYLDYYSQVKEMVTAFFTGNFEVEPAAKSWLEQPFSKPLIKNFHDRIMSLKDFNEETIAEAIKASGKEMNVKGKNLFMTIRVAATGKEHGMDLPTYIRLTGKEEIINRLCLFIEK